MEQVMAGSEADRILEKLVKEVEAAVHALYRGEVRQQTAQTRSGSILREAKASLQALIDGGAGAPPRPSGSNLSPRPSASAPVVAGAAAGLTREEGEAVMKCITAWLPMGSPRDAAPDGKCIAAMRELTPTWGQRERAREAVKRISQA
jgi:hypothetical protein